MVRWEDIPDNAPIYLIANEFFDALPVRQYVLRPDGWHERVVSAEGGQLKFALTPEAQAIDWPLTGHGAAKGNEAREGAVLEVSPGANAIMAGIADYIARSNGVGVIVDYGYSEPGYGDTFQAVRSNRFADPLSNPGGADVTAHVDFTALKQSASAAGARVSGPVNQGHFLERLGIHLRASRLKSAAPEGAKEVDAAVARLTDGRQMGTLFKAMALSRPDSTQLPGFSC